MVQSEKPARVDCPDSAPGSFIQTRGFIRKNRRNSKQTKRIDTWTQYPGHERKTPIARHNPSTLRTNRCQYFFY